MAYVLIYVGVPAFVGLCIWAVIYNRKHRDKLLQEGKMIIREPGFYEKAEIFTIYGVPLNKIWDYLDIETIKSNGVYAIFVPDKGRLEFNYSGYNEKWFATLQWTDSQNNINVYNLTVHSFKTEGSRKPTDFPLNVMYTAVEKAFLANDPNTKVTAQYVERKTKRSFF